jgi:hypothetical protein
MPKASQISRFQREQFGIFGIQSPSLLSAVSGAMSSCSQHQRKENGASLADVSHRCGSHENAPLRTLAASAARQSEIACETTAAISDRHLPASSS